MPAGLEIAIELAGAAGCSLIAALLVWWAHPVGGELSPRLRQRGMETLVSGTASLAGILGLAFVVGAILQALK
jgi:hypothetical protein